MKLFCHKKLLLYWVCYLILFEASEGTDNRNEINPKDSIPEEKDTLDSYYDSNDFCSVKEPRWQVKKKRKNIRKKKYIVKSKVDIASLQNRIENGTGRTFTEMKKPLRLPIEIRKSTKRRLSESRKSYPNLTNIIQKLREQEIPRHHDWLNEELDDNEYRKVYCKKFKGFHESEMKNSQTNTTTFYNSEIEVEPFAIDPIFPLTEDAVTEAEYGRKTAVRHKIHKSRKRSASTITKTSKDGKERMKVDKDRTTVVANYNTEDEKELGNSKSNTTLVADRRPSSSADTKKLEKLAKPENPENLEKHPETNLKFSEEGSSTENLRDQRDEMEDSSYASKTSLQNDAAGEIKPLLQQGAEGHKLEDPEQKPDIIKEHSKLSSSVEDPKEDSIIKEHAIKKEVTVITVKDEDSIINENAAIKAHTEPPIPLIPVPTSTDTIKYENNTSTSNQDSIEPVLKPLISPKTEEDTTVAVPESQRSTAISDNTDKSLEKASNDPSNDLDNDEYNSGRASQDDIDVRLHQEATLKFMQRLLLLVAAGTFLSIVLYSVYYINQLRRIYARKTRISK